MSAYWPFVVIGVFTGSLYGLAAMGMVLTYKTVGVFNFAYGAVAMFCAFTYWQVHDAWGVTAWLAMPLLFLVVAPVLGLVLEALFRPLSGAAVEVVDRGVPRSAGGTDGGGRPDLAPGRARAADLPQLDVRSRLSPPRGLRPARHAARLAGHGRRCCGACCADTRFGASTRAVVDNPDLSDMIGVHGDNVRRVAWILSSRVRRPGRHPHQPDAGRWTSTGSSCS